MSVCLHENKMKISVTYCNTTGHSDKQQGSACHVYTVNMMFLIHYLEIRGVAL
jgi:hypothetical protein